MVHAVDTIGRLGDEIWKELGNDVDSRGRGQAPEDRCLSVHNDGRVETVLEACFRHVLFQRACEAVELGDKKDINSRTSVREGEDESARRGVNEQNVQETFAATNRSSL